MVSPPADALVPGALLTLFLHRVPFACIFLVLTVLA
jgi:hypothetical protein